MTTQFGVPITATEAQLYFDAEMRVQNGKKSLLKTIVSPYQQQEQQEIDMAIVYNSSCKNAFVFEKKLVLDLLNEKDKNGKVADYLMIHFAAKYKDGTDFKIGEPTLVILGCHKNDTDNFFSMDLEFPADEQPGRVSISKVPTTGTLEAARNVHSNNVIVFTLK